jgi:NAD-dependent dihydropyrimidine dehydrogenase PreA subunit
MIAAILPESCTQCGTCVAVCPSNVFALDAAGAPNIARQADCQTCFLCELYCPADALYVDPDCESPAEVDTAALKHRGVIGKFRRDSGWGDSPAPNDHWRMDGIFARGRAL